MLKTIAFLVLLFPSLLFAQSRKVVVMDMTQYNAETSDARYKAVMRTMDLTGLPYDTTSNLQTALQYPVVITGSRILDTVFSAQEVIDIENFVSNGGILITSGMRNSQLFTLFGITGTSNNSTHKRIQFDTTQHQELFQQIDDSLEVEISMGDTDQVSSYAHRFYHVSTASVLGRHEDDSAAFIYHAFGNGHVYAFGPDFRDLTQRNQLDLDIDAQRTYSNGFEPSSDVVMFILRNIIRKHIPNSVYKYTQFFDAESCLIITHDIDSKTAVDTMLAFSAFEKNAGIVGQYNITTRYVHDSWMTGFYLGSGMAVDQLIQDGHVIASHSVGHFPDFDNESVFPYGTQGNVAGSYMPTYFSGITTGGTVLGELEVSKELLESDHGIPIRSFRAGHLCFHDSLYYGLSELGYEFNSTMSANNVMHSFPYYGYFVRSFSSEPSPILEIPMTISDVFSADPFSDTNKTQKVQIWVNALRKYHANNAPVNILIHPNRMYKLTAQQMLIDSLPSGMIICGFEDYGRFWRKRDSLQFHTTVSNDTLFIDLENAYWQEEQSFVVDMFGIDTVIVRDASGMVLDYTWKARPDGQRLYYHFDNNISVEEESEHAKPFMLYPNPSNGIFYVASAIPMHQTPIELYNISGALVFSGAMQGHVQTVDIRSLNLPDGIYVIRINHNTTQRLVLSK